MAEWLRHWTWIPMGFPCDFYWSLSIDDSLPTSQFLEIVWGQFLGLLVFKQDSIVEKQICVLVDNFASFKIYLSMHVNCNTLKLLCYCILLWRYRKLNQFFSSKFLTLGEAQTHSLQNYENDVLPIVLQMPVTISKMFKLTWYDNSLTLYVINWICF